MDDEKVKRNERNVFLFISVLLWPILAMVIVGTYGLMVWIYQMIMGPPRG